MQRIEEKGAHIVVATVGRLYDVAVDKRALDFSKLEVLVMDEADKMMEQSANEVQLQTIL